MIFKTLFFHFFRDHHPHHKKGFMRLNSVEDESPYKMTSEKINTNLPPSPSSKESKWFSDYPQTNYNQAFMPQFGGGAPTGANWGQNYPSHFWGPASAGGYPNYQVPYNLTKGQFEVWPMQPFHHQNQSCYLTHQQPHQLSYTQSHPGHQHHQQQSCHQHQEDQDQKSISGIVNYVLEAGVSVLASAMTSFTSFTSWSGSCAPQATSTTSSSTMVYRATLNPNAKAFTPLNPHAKEFHPASNGKSPQVPESSASVTPPNGKIEENSSNITPETKVDMKSVAYRKCTPWIPKGPGGKHVPPTGSSDISSEELVNSDLDSDLESDLEDDDDDFEGQDNDQRPRLLSICSSENDFIQFTSTTENSPRCKSPPKIPEKPSTFLKNFLAGHEDDEESDDDEEDSDDDDYDADWDTTIDAIFLDDESQLKELGLHCQWMHQHLPSKSVDVVDNKIKGKLVTLIYVKKFRESNIFYSVFSCG